MMADTLRPRMLLLGAALLLAFQWMPLVSGTSGSIALLEGVGMLLEDDSYRRTETHSALSAFPQLATPCQKIAASNLQPLFGAALTERLLADGSSCGRHHQVALQKILLAWQRGDEVTVAEHLSSISLARQLDIGRNRYEMGDLALGRVILETVAHDAVKLAPSDRLQFYQTLGDLYTEAGEERRAATAHDFALQLNPEKTGLALTLAQRLRRMGRSDEALRVLDRSRPYLTEQQTMQQINYHIELSTNYLALGSGSSARATLEVARDLLISRRSALLISEYETQTRRLDALAGQIEQLGSQAPGIQEVPSNEP